MCVDCTNGCPDTTLDKCVQYSGPDNATLGICTGDPLYKVEAQLITFLTSTLNATGIKLASITNNCDFFKSQMGTNAYTLDKVIDALIKGECALKQMIDTINSAVTPISVNAPCLGLASGATRDDILKAVAAKVCVINTAVTAISTDYVKASQLNSLIAAYIASTTPTSTSGTTQQYTKMVPYVAYEYYGPLSNFDATGKGLSSTSFDKVYICNGSNGTPDRRGRVAVGAILGVQGSVALDAAVDPTLPANAGKNYALKDKFGSSSVTLSITQIPAHTHAVTDPGHTHPVNAKLSNGVSGSDSTLPTPTPDSAVLNTKTATTGISIAAAGGGAAHDNVQPSIGANFIMYLP